MGAQRGVQVDFGTFFGGPGTPFGGPLGQDFHIKLDLFLESFFEAFWRQLFIDFGSIFVPMLGPFLILFLKPWI